MSAEGGEHETVEMFVLEAYEANVVLQHYEAASGPTVNVRATARYMSNRKPPTMAPPPVPQKQKRRFGHKTTSSPRAGLFGGPTTR